MYVVCMVCSSKADKKLSVAMLVLLDYDEKVSAGSAIDNLI